METPLQKSWIRPCVGYYSQVNCTIGVTREYSQLINKCLRAVCSLCRASYTQNFSRHDALHVLVCKLGRELYHRDVAKWLHTTLLDEGQANEHSHMTGFD